ncbi:J domain-containing protein, putative [Perkinsus marinus ATCC 50983]|uniref:J domain-containing protein, putative n=1 Tax=Perkinsus marinus (strain ATCC 50983 / TXsc) TaxID=423536 RepID=C5LKQ0_PERM5|nr:J domain-containing protein, putative [Perkinsus marinus ATCC 50983]EER02694.1 J domain-containing protein, putative [Perkinsus marinus ATCC 50983]|eukprot:XP_002770438.1 J domain-containing protein, putative [Perkinsus marinus ATCC 50983]
MVASTLPDCGGMDLDDEAFYDAVISASGMKDRQDCFRILGLTAGAGLEEIKTAYRRLARRWHPDKYDGHRDANTVFQHVNEAYSVLTKKRSTHSYYPDEYKKSDLSQWLDQSWDWQSQRERQNWEKNGRTVVVRGVQEKYQRIVLRTWGKYEHTTAGGEGLNGQSHQSAPGGSD